MSYRWVLSPVTQIIIPDPQGGAELFRAAKVYEHIDPARGKPYAHSSVIHSHPWALSVVMADDFTPLDLDPLCISLLETEFADPGHLELTPRDMAFTVPHLARIKARLETRGVDVTAFTRDTPIADMLQALALTLQPGLGDIRRTWLNPPPALKLPFVEDAVTFSDSFTEGADTVLDSHTPSPTGTSWVLVSQLTNTISVIAATDQLRGTSAGTALGALYKSQPNPAVVEYDVQWTVAAVDTGSATRPCRLHARQTDAANWYAAKLRPTAHATNALELVKSIADAITVLATVDQAWAANDTCLLRMRDAAKSVRVNGAEVLTSADNALTAAGAAGVSMGKFSATGDAGNMNTVWLFDDYLVDEVAAAAGGLFRAPALDGLSAGGPFLANPIG
jgi:hypothetical protein